MKARILTALMAIVSTYVLGGCSAPGPVVRVPPTVKVSHFNSVLFTPDEIRFQAKVVINNQMRAALDVDKVEWGADLHDQRIFSETFSDLKSTRSRGKQTVTFPFTIAMKDVVDQGVDVLAEESIRVDFRGSVYPVGFDPVPFEATKTISLPKVPVVSIDGAEGSPLNGVFKVVLRVENPNDFPLGVQSVDSHVTLNGKNYNLMCTTQRTDVAADGSGRIKLEMKKSRGKALSMVFNAVTSQSTDFAIGGSFKCQTPHGLVFVPLELSSN